MPDVENPEIKEPAIWSKRGPWFRSTIELAGAKFKTEPMNLDSAMRLYREASSMGFGTLKLQVSDGGEWRDFRPEEYP